MTELEVNGQRRSVSAGPDTALLYVLRNDLGLVGSRFGCGNGQCGVLRDRRGQGGAVVRHPALER